MGQPTSFKVSIKYKNQQTQRRYTFSSLVTYFLLSMFCAEIALSDAPFHGNFCKRVLKMNREEIEFTFFAYI